LRRLHQHTSKAHFIVRITERAAVQIVVKIGIGCRLRLGLRRRRLRCRKFHTQAGLHPTAKFRHRRINNDDLAGPAINSIAKRGADDAIVDAVEDQALFAVGELDNEFLFLVLAHTNKFFRDIFDLALFISSKISSFPEAALIVLRR
jgi:hypothetical protein